MNTKAFYSLLAIGICSCTGLQLNMNQTIAEQDDRSHQTSSPTYYWCDGEKIPLSVNNNKLYIVAENDIHTKSLVASCASISVDVKDVYAEHSIIPRQRIDTQSTQTEMIIDTSTTEPNLDNAAYFAPFYKTTDGAEIGLTNILSVQISNNDDMHKLEEIANEYNLTILGNNEFDNSIIYLSCSKESKGNTLEISNIIYESGVFDFVAPEFIIESSPSFSPNDNYYTGQWNLNNSTNPGIDIGFSRIYEDYSFPNINNIIVAVIDDGIYKNHPDLPLGNISFNAHTGKSPSVQYGSHATEVAGIIGATTNNNVGIAGVASGVQIMDISLCYTENAKSLGMQASTTSSFANAIRFAANNGAKIINNSWSFGTSSPIPEINNAIKYAHSKGCIVVFSSGNNGGTATQPAASAPSSTLVVGAIKQNGIKADFSSYGSYVDVVAPGVDIWTTTDNGYYTLVNGTSYAAPHICGIAALIWATNPSLPAWRVCDILEQSTKRVGMNEYQVDNIVRLNGPWNQFYGYGLVDAYKAISSARAQEPSDPVIHTDLNEVDNAFLLSLGIDRDDQEWNSIYLAPSYGDAIISIANYDPSATYVWTSTLPPYSGYGASFTVDCSAKEEDTGTFDDIQCSILKNGYRKTSGISLLIIQ